MKAREQKKLEIDPCPWCPGQKPGWSVRLEGSHDDPYVVIRAECPECGSARSYSPTEEEVRKHYESRYSLNHAMIAALYPKLVKTWNWKTPTN